MSRLVKFTLSDAEEKEVAAWADGVRLGPLVKRELMRIVRTQQVLVRYPAGTSQVPWPMNHAGTPQVPAEYPAGTSPEPGTDPALQSLQKKKEKEKKKEDSSVSLDFIRLVVDDLNERAGTNYRATGSRAKALIQAWVNKGATLSDFQTVHRKKCAEWKGTDNAKYLRPSTLYGPKFDEYLNQPATPQRTARKATIRDRDAARRQTDWNAVGDQIDMTGNDPNDGSFDVPDVKPRGRTR